jgi:hypothetical protein
LRRGRFMHLHVPLNSFLKLRDYGRLLIDALMLARCGHPSGQYGRHHYDPEHHCGAVSHFHSHAPSHHLEQFAFQWWTAGEPRLGNSANSLQNVSFCRE